MFIETQSRAIAKAVSYRIFGTLLTSGIVYLMTKEVKAALAVGGLELFGKVAVYWGHERVWEMVRFGRKKIDPCIIWFTGLSGAGKTTLSLEVYKHLKDRGYAVEHLDGDTIRDLFPTTGFSREERSDHVRRIGHLASRLESHGVFVIVSLISPYRDSRDFVRSICKNFVEIHVATPLSVCESRDVKGLYAKARRGDLKNFTGIDSDYEEPLTPEIRVDTSQQPEAQVAQDIVGHLHKYLG